MSVKLDLPLDHQEYYDSTVERTKSLIANDVWSELQPIRLANWLGNFTTESEKYLSACILDNLIYRSKDQTLSLFDHLFESLLPPHADDKKLQELILVAVQKRTDPPGKSTSELIRMLTRHFGVIQNKTIYPWQIGEKYKLGYRHFVFIDDIIGTGRQIRGVLKEHDFFESYPDAIFIYAPLVAFNKGLIKVQKAFPKLKLCPVETLDDSYSFFNNESYRRELDEKQLRDFCAEFGKERKVRIMGYGSTNLLYLFSHASPNNTLPLLWQSTHGWQPLTDR